MEKIKKIQLQCLYFGVSLVSSLCVINNFYTVTCCNIVTTMCLFDFYYVKKKDMLLHHVCVVMLGHYMNTHPVLEYRNEIISVVLSTEISTIFLTTKNLLDITGYKTIARWRICPFRTINNYMFVFTFLYYRIYNYSYLIFNKKINDDLLLYSKNNLELFEIYFGMYVLFIVNLYWSSIIFKKILDSPHN